MSSLNSGSPDAVNYSSVSSGLLNSTLAKVPQQLIDICIFQPLLNFFNSIWRQHFKTNSRIKMQKQQATLLECI